MSSAGRLEDHTVPPPSTRRNSPNRRTGWSRIGVLFEPGAGTDVVKFSGELDITSSARVQRRCIAGPGHQVVVDLADVTFLDCGGYRGFMAARAELALHHRSLALVGAVGQPRRLLDLISQLETENQQVAPV